RSVFLRGQVDKYTWVDYGSSYLPSDMNAAYLWAQLEMADEINENRLATWNYYHESFKDLADQEKLVLPTIPEDCVHNAHMYYVKLRDLEERTAFISYLKSRGILSVFHYVPLHSAPAGLRFGRFHGEDRYTTSESDRLARLPLYYNMDRKDTDAVIEAVHDFFRK
ncbi:MAG: DegT/DnrJ/EryC1/StrS family aminotransferase, partial [Lachnospiraceae bacterium]|nr:DegT/DnrJ/EryC1/StrS family aminotransferase [Lachnospiraceae bacterium]